MVSNKTYQNLRDKRLVRPRSKYPFDKDLNPYATRPNFHRERMYT